MPDRIIEIDEGDPEEGNIEPELLDDSDFQLISKNTKGQLF